MTVQAPGKAMLFGEYAVLDGAWGLVAAVDRAAIAWLDPEEAPEALSPFVAAAQSAARAYLISQGRALPAGAPLVDSSKLYAGDRKLGLGSSAAVTVAACGAVLDAAGVTLDEAMRAPLFTLCDRAHASAQGAMGSGLDVAAAVWGGVLRARRRDDGSLEVDPIAWPNTLAATYVDTGVAASTADRVARYRALDRDRAEVQSLDEGLRTVADRFRLDAPLATVADDVGAWNELLQVLGALLGRDVMTPEIETIDAIAREVGGAAKPSGAGGGDLCVCFHSPEAGADLTTRLLAHGFRPIALATGAPGLARTQNHATENPR